MWLRPDAIQGASGGAGYRRGASWGCHRGTCKRPAGAVGCVYARRSRSKKKTHRHTQTHIHRDTHRHIHTGTHILHRLPAAAMRGWGGVGRLRRFLTPAECCSTCHVVSTPSTFVPVIQSHQSFHSRSHNMHSLKGHLSHISFSRSRRCLHGHGHFHIIPFLLPHL